jgi:hypothetical protein
MSGFDVSTRDYRSGTSVPIDDDTAEQRGDRREHTAAKDGTQNNQHLS